MGFFNLAVLDVPKPKEVVVVVDGNFATQNFAKSAELGVKIGVVPLSLLESSDVDGSGLDVFATWFTFDGVHVVGECSAHLAILDLRELELFLCFFSILNCFKHHKSVVEGPEQSSLDVDLAWSHVSLVEVSQVQVCDLLGQVAHEDHSMGIFMLVGVSRHGFHLVKL